MTKPVMKTLSNRAVAKLTVEKDTVFWDRDLTGFGVRVYPAGGKVYVAQARGPGGTRRVAVGRHGVIHADEARKRAAHVIARIKAGEEAVPKPMKPAGGPTVAELAKRYLDEYVSVRCKPRTVKTLRSVVCRHVVPSLGKMPLASVERAHVAELHQRLSATPAAANQAVRALSAMYKLAESWELAPEGLSNPCLAIAEYPAGRRERFLTEAEFMRLGSALDQAETKGGASASAVAAIRLLMLTGLPEVGDPQPALGGGGARSSGTAARGLQDGRAGRFALGTRGEPPLGSAAHPRGPLGDSRQETGHAPQEARRRLAVRPGARGSSRRALARPASFVRLEGARARRGAFRDREAPGPRADRDHLALRPSRARFGARIRRAGRREHRRRPAAGGLLKKPCNQKRVRRAFPERPGRTLLFMMFQQPRTGEELRDSGTLTCFFVSEFPESPE